jgi:hypothetical protein
VLRTRIRILQDCPVDLWLIPIDGYTLPRKNGKRCKLDNMSERDIRSALNSALRVTSPKMASARDTGSNVIAHLGVAGLVLARQGYGRGEGRRKTQNRPANSLGTARGV